jgi:hypothetical protein
VAGVPVLVQLTIADAPATWAALGFAVAPDGACQIGDVQLRLAGRTAGKGLVGWTLDGATSTQLDGLPTALVEGGAPPAPAPAHPNGVTVLDHVVAISPRLDRTVAALQTAGLDLRRIREQPTPAGAPRQAFFRLGAALLEVVQAPDEALARSGGAEGPAFFWGLALRVDDLDATIALLGPERVSEARAAVQPGQRIATLRRAAGLALPLALMTPPA